MPQTIIADVAANDPKAEFSLKELAMNVGAGAVSGGIFGAGATAANRLVKAEC